jgi:sugar/nucleoside kinase (ribokinase family)
VNTGPVLVIGEIVTDIIARVSDPIAVASDTRAKITLRPGGAGGNVAAWMAELGANISLVAAIGEDASGRALEEELLARGVKPRLVRRPGSSSGSVLVLVDHVGERTMLTDAANGDLTTGDIPAGVFDECTHLHLSGYVLLDRRTRSFGVEALASARAAGLTTSVDPASAALITEVGPKEFLRLTEGVDVVLPAYDEGRELASSKDVEVILSRLGESYGEVAMTLGPEGAIWVGSGGERLTQPAQIAEEVVDLVGAGDAFVAGWLTAGAAGETPGDQLESGCRAGTQAVTAVGAWPPRS